MIYDKIFPATWVSDDGKSYSSAEARRLGYRSKTQWKPLGRVPDPSAVPSLVVSKVARCRGRPCALILRVLPDDMYEYADQYYCVYPEADTVVPAPKTRKSRKSVISAAVVADLPSGSSAEAELELEASSSCSCPSVASSSPKGIPDSESSQTSSVAISADLSSDSPVEAATEPEIDNRGVSSSLSPLSAMSSSSRAVQDESSQTSSVAISADLSSDKSVETSSSAAIFSDLLSDSSAETAPQSKNGKTADQLTDVSFFFSCPVTPPYDAHFSRKAKEHNDLAKTETAVLAHAVNNGERTKKRGRKAEEWEYLPEGFDWSKVPKSLAGGVRYLFHLLYVNRIIRRMEKDEFINLNARTFRRIVRQGDAVRYWAVKSGLVQCDNFYEKGRKSLGYRLCPELAQRTWRLIRRTSKAIVRNLRKTEGERSPVVRWLTKNLDRIEAVIPEGLPWLDELALYRRSTTGASPSTRRTSSGAATTRT